MFLCETAFAQQRKDSTWIGVVTGIVNDSAHNYVLPSASIAIYKKKDSSLVSYQLTNNFGEFHFEGIPIGIELILKVDYIGYRQVGKEFLIPARAKAINLKTIDLERKNDLLAEAVVSCKPPVRMNGDTLEFNADAFRLDSNAVGEDLLRRLPGVTVWGDGTITVNGRQVHQVLVDGKPFFGGDTRVATQNISKNAIDKIQVYQQKNDMNNSYDSVTDINIKLKKDKNSGHFGKLSAGYGTDDRYESDANVNFFRPSTQVSVVAATNNVNKIAADAGTLLRNSTYKGNGARIDYQPDFGLLGTNRPYMAGLSIQHDFLPDVNFYKTSRLSADYFLNSNKNITDAHTQTLTSLGAGNTLFERDDNNAETNNTTQNANIRYEKKNYRQSFFLQGGFRNNNAGITTNSADSVRLDNTNLQSTNTTDNTLDRNSTGIQLEAGFTTSKNTNSGNNRPGDLVVDYSFRDTGMRYDQALRTEFTSLVDPTQSVSYDRQYNDRLQGNTHQLSAGFGDFSKWIFGYEGFAAHLSMKVLDSLVLQTRQADDVVRDRDKTTGVYLTNAYLTGNSRYTTTDEMPAWDVNLNFSKGFTGRYYRSFQLDLTPRAQFYRFTDRSTREFQDISYSYQKFTPAATVSYTDDRLGRYTNTWMLTFKTQAIYPTVDQLVPVVDSSNRYSIVAGNPLLKAADEKELNFTMQHNSAERNAFGYMLTASAGTVHNNFSDSSTIDSLGRSFNYTVNAHGYAFLNVSGDLKKAFKNRNSQFQVDFTPSLGYIRSPGYINGLSYHSLTVNTAGVLDLYYTYKDIVAIDLREAFTHYQARQEGIMATYFKNDLYSSLFSASVRPLERLTCGSSIAYNLNSSTGSDAVHFTIWNASAAYRLLRGNNLELKFSALDLLHQNTGITNHGSLNTLTHGTVNVLQQYFMFTVSYFPRRFGKTAKNSPPTQN